MLAFVIGGQEIIWIVVAVGLLFGATRIPMLMRGMGQGIKEFKSAVKDDEPATPAPPETPPPANGETTQSS